MKIYTINSGYLGLDGGAMFGVVPKTIWQKLISPDEDNLCFWAMRCMLVVFNDKKILIDTGMGNKQPLKFSNFYKPKNNDLTKALNDKGFKPSEITDVILSHLHFDHSGGAIKLNEKNELVPFFPNAKYWVSENQWNHAMKPNKREKPSFLPENLLPIQEHGKLNFIDAKKRLYDFIEFEENSGHTIGQLLTTVHKENQKVIFTADLIPSSFHISPNFIMAYDINPLITMADKGKFLEKAVKEKSIIIFDHDPIIEGAIVTEGEKGVMIGEKFTF